MSEARCRGALEGAHFSGYVDIKALDPVGMITMRADLSSVVLKSAIKQIFNCSVPDAPRKMLRARDDIRLGWMSPDELLLLCPYGQAPMLCSELEAALKRAHILVANMSDARACFRLEGARAAEIIAKLSPVDVSPLVFAKDTLWRTRLGQIPAAFWMETPERIQLVCFRSHAQYAFDILCHASAPGSEVF